ncbi:hypothetical protein AYO49_04110 [Verrucomicrobiaceae bacterium SCGC AG-212-N21]|nr:hypothetical protein AYO49_04110 [Verrucomicrobiaceae bacterium SCGC AG-212-N21]
MITRLLSTAILFVAVSLPAAEKAAPKPGASAKRLPLQGTVISINTRTLTLKGGEGKPDRKFTINRDTVIVKGESPATTEDVKEGQRVTGSYYKNAEEANILTKLQVAPKPVAKKTDSKDDGKTKKTESTAKKSEGETKKKST